MDIETIKIECSGYVIVADWYQGNNDKVVLVLHGYSSSKKRQSQMATALHGDTGASILAIDLSGHGDSPFELKDTRPAQHLLEVVCAFDWIKQYYPMAEITVAGSSYGGYLAANLTNYRVFERLLLRAPAIFKPSTFYDPWAHRIAKEQDYVDEILQYRRDRDQLAKHPLFANKPHFTGNVLVMVHENDNLVPRETTDAYITAFSADSYVAKGFPHSLSGMADADLAAYRAHISNWLNA